MLRRIFQEEGQPTTPSGNSEPSAGWAVRNATAHGQLSATKAQEWGLVVPIQRLTDHVCAAVRAGHDARLSRQRR